MAYQVIQMNENTWRIENEMVRFFLLAGTESALLIDSGMTVKNVKEILAELTDLPVMLLNTHADPDHIGGNAEFDSFYMHPAEASNYYKTQKQTGHFLPVEEGDVIDLGDRQLEIIALPGHTAGSIAVLDLTNKMLFSGDPVQDGDIFMFGSQRELHAYIHSLKKLEDLQECFDIICPSHGSIPLDKSWIGKLIGAAEDILAGKAEKVPGEMFGNPIAICPFGFATFLIDRDQ